MGRLQILWITQQMPHFPGPGGETRQYSLLRGLAPDHAIHVVVAARAGETPRLTELRQLGLTVHPVAGPPTLPRSVPAAEHDFRGAIRSTMQAVPEVVRYLHRWAAPFAAALAALPADSWDVVQVEQSHLAGLLAPRLPPHRVRVADVYDLLADVQWTTMRQQARVMPAHRRAYWLLDWCKLRRYEARVAARYSRCLVVSPRDRARLHRRAPRARIATVPNGVDPGYFAACSARAAPAVPTIVFTGTLHYWPNVDAVQFFAQEVLPLVWTTVPEARFVIAGRGPGPAVTSLAADPRVTVCADVPDIRPVLAQADVIVAPLRHGSGTRIKILEAWSMGKAVVATAKGCEGLDCRSGSELLVADSPTDLAGAVVRLLHEPATRQALAEAGTRLVRERYQWARAVDRLNAVYAEALAR